MVRANRTAMPSEVHTTDAFIAYPTNRVVGSIADPERAQEAIEALLGVGFAREDIDILHSEEDLHRADKSGNDRRFLSQFQRTVVHTLADEHKHLSHYVDEVRAGHSVIMVLAKKRGRRETAADILGSHGAAGIEYYGRWAWHALEPHAVAPSDDSPDPAAGRTYEVHLGETTTRVRLDSESRLTILGGSAITLDLSRIPVTHLKPRLLMITWQEADRTTNVHVYDFDTGEAHAVVSYANRSVHRVRGTVRRAN